jgi:hypothetical protein
MNPLSGLIAPVLALLPVAGIAPDLPGPPEPAPAALLPAPPPPVQPSTDRALESFAETARAMRQQENAGQVRIEQRIIIRIAPGLPSRDLRDERRSLFGPAGRPLAPRMEERKMTQCLAVAGIAGVQPDGPTRLMLFMRDQRIVSAALEKSCNARDFYSGFLVERSTDGMICAGRDKLLSRSGSNCALGKLKQLVATAEDDE